MLRIRDLCVNYGRVEAVRHLDLDVAAGEAVALVGPNGAGKSTTLAATVGLQVPKGGTIDFDGNVLIGLPPERVVRLGLTLVPEGRQIFNTLTVAENLRIGATIRKRSDVAGDLEMVLEHFPVLRDFRHTYAGSLSGGEQQQLAIARALLARPKLLLLDEPSLGLAPKVVDVVFESLERLREEGVSLLLVEQNARRAIAFADRTYVIQGGEMRMSGESQDFQDGAELEAAYFGRDD